MNLKQCVYDRVYNFVFDEIMRVEIQRLHENMFMQTIIQSKWEANPLHSILSMHLLDEKLYEYVLGK